MHLSEPMYLLLRDIVFQPVAQFWEDWRSRSHPYCLRPSSFEYSSLVVQNVSALLPPKSSMIGRMLGTSITDLSSLILHEVRGIRSWQDDNTAAVIKSIIPPKELLHEMHDAAHERPIPRTSHHNQCCTRERQAGYHMDMTTGLARWWSCESFSCANFPNFPFLSPSITSSSTTFQIFTIVRPSISAFSTIFLSLSTIGPSITTFSRTFPKFTILFPSMTSSSTTFGSSITTFSTLSLLNCSAVHLLFVTTLVSPTSTYFQLRVVQSCLHACLSTNGRFFAQHNENHTSFFNLDFDNSQKPFQRRTADSSFFGFPHRHNQLAGVSLHAQASGSHQTAVAAHVPSNCFAQRQCSRRVHLPRPLQHLAHDRQLHDVSQLDLFNTRDSHRHFTVNCFLCGGCYWLWHHGNPSLGVRWQCCWWRFSSTNAHFHRISGLRSCFCLRDWPLLPLLATVTGCWRRWLHEQSSLGIWIRFNWILSRISCCACCWIWHFHCCCITISPSPLLCSPFLFSQRLVDHFISSILPFCPLWSDSETSFNPLPATIWVCLCPRVVFDRIATLTSDSGPEVLKILFGNSFPLNPYTFAWCWRTRNRIFPNFWTVHCPPAVCHSPHNSTYIVDGFFVPSAPRFQPPDFKSSEYPICIPDEAFCTVAAHSEPDPEFASWVRSVHRICGDLFCQHLVNKRNKFLRRHFQCNLLNGVFPSRPFWHLDRMHPACSTNHGNMGDSSLSGSCVVLSIWRLMVRMIPRICITAFSTSPFDCLSPFTASSVVTSALYISSTRSIAKVGLLVSSSLLCLVAWWWLRPLPIMKGVHQSLNGTCVTSCSSLFFCVGLFLGPALTRQSGVADSSSLSTPSASTDISSLPLQLRSMLLSSDSANFPPSALSRSHNAAGLAGSSKAAWPLTVLASWKLDPFRLCKPTCPSCTPRCSRPAWSSFRLGYFECADSFRPARQCYQLGLLFCIEMTGWQHSDS